MKKTYNTKRSIAFYLIFVLLFCATSFLLIMLSNNFTQSHDTSVTVDNTAKPNIVIIDAGHGGEDGGAIGVNGGYEKDVNLSLSFILRDVLTQKGIEVVMTRSEDILLYDKNSDHVGHKKEQDLLNRRKIVESYEDPIFVSIHMNSFPSEKYSGLQVYYSKNTPSSKLLANRIQENSRLILSPQNKRTIKSSEGIYLLDRLECTSVLVECGFLSNKTECELLFTEEYQRKVAECIAIAICDQLKAQKGEVDT